MLENTINSKYYYYYPISTYDSIFHLLIASLPKIIITLKIVNTCFLYMGKVKFRSIHSPFLVMEEMKVRGLTSMKVYKYTASWNRFILSVVICDSVEFIDCHYRKKCILLFVWYYSEWEEWVGKKVEPIIVCLTTMHSFGSKEINSFSLRFVKCGLALFKWKFYCRQWNRQTTLLTTNHYSVYLFFLP